MLRKPFISLAESDPDLASQAFGWDPTQVTRGSNKKLTWKCSLGHIWETSVAHRSSGTNCPFCSNQKVLSGYNDISSTNPEIAVEAYDWDPTNVSPGSNRKLEWQCSKNHKWQASPASRTKLGTGCPICSNQKIVTGINDLAFLRPDIASEANGWDASLVGVGDGKKREWKCISGHIYIAQVLKRTKRNQGCPVCANKRIIPGLNDIETTHPDIAAEAHGWDPKTINAGRGSKIGNAQPKLNWKCPVGHIYQATPASRTNPKILSGCPYCSGNTNLEGFNDLATTHPEIAAEAYGWNPSKSRGTHKKKAKWKCKLGHIYDQTITERMQGANCPYCSGRKLLKGFNDLLTTNPALANEAFEWDPTTLTANSQKLKKWKCKEGHTWNSTVGNRNSGRGCPTCSESGFNPNKKGYLYFIEHLSWQMLQIGITNYPENRLKSHQKLGWELIEIRGPMDGHLAQQWETGILRMLKFKGADLANPKIAGKFDGYSEAWSINKFQVYSIRELMDVTEEFEGRI